MPAFPSNLKERGEEERAQGWGWFLQREEDLRMAIRYGKASNDSSAPLGAGLMQLSSATQETDD